MFSLRTLPEPLPNTGHVSRIRRRAAALAVTVGLAAAATVATGAPAYADNPPGSWDPHGEVTSLSGSGGQLNVAGWAYDPSARTSNLTVVAVIDGVRLASSTVTSRANAAVRTAHHTGATPGFAMSVPVPSGLHTICIAVRDLGAGMNTVLRCVATPLGRSLTTTQRAAHSPRGAVLHQWANPHSVHFQGWATDPDYVYRRSIVVLYLDNHPVASVPTTTAWSPRATNAGPNSKFDILVPASVGTHVGCIWVVDVGFGSNRFLGCSVVDTRGHAGTGTVPHPSTNAKVATEAKKHIGQPYVWGATGPSRFDCSGLVQYSYRKFGTTVPRVSQDQFRAARLIPASRAVAGDPVFYFDSQGDVYHVGIYLRPGKTVAAIDVAEGVDYQGIWDPSMTAYGSFTHT